MTFRAILKFSECTECQGSRGRSGIVKRVKNGRIYPYLTRYDEDTFAR